MEKQKTKDTYTVKYIGVVEGSMGILSRKMRMPKYVEASVYQQKEHMSQLQSHDNITFMNYTNLPTINDEEDTKVKFGVKKNNRNKTVVGGFNKRNIVIDKPLLSTKRESVKSKYKNLALVSHPKVVDDATSTKSQLHNRHMSESDDDVRTPVVKLQPVGNVNKQNDRLREDSKEANALYPIVSANVKYHSNNEVMYQNETNYEDYPPKSSDSGYENQVAIAYSGK
jgi:hypothetical protein